MEQFHFNYKDITRVHRYGFSGRRIGIHLVGILLAYIIYQTLVYVTLIVGDIKKAQDLWSSHGLLPPLPFTDNNLNLLTTGTMWVGLLAFAFVFFLTSTLAAKITIEQIRGNTLYAVGEALRVLKVRLKTVFGSFFGLMFVLFFLLLIPICIVFMSKIPFLRGTFLTISSVFIPVGFLLGLIILFTFTVFITSLFLVPAMVASTNVDAFEIIYQLFSTVWNQPWRLLGYGTLLFFLKIIHVPIWAIFCIGGFLIALLPTYYLHPSFLQDALVYANKWLGGTVQNLSSIILRDDNSLFGLNTSQLPEINFSLTICAIFLTLTLICIAGGIVAYLFSLTSVGTTIIYVIIRRYINGENILITEASSHQQPLRIGDE